MLKITINDGGRKEAGFTGATGDCVTRAIAIAFKKPYKEIYDTINATAESERPGKWYWSRGAYRQRGKSNARKGVYKKTYKKIIEQLGGVWTPTMHIGSGCKVHLRSDELPAKGTYIVSVSKHLTVMIDGVLHDTYDCSRDGTRCVYGYYTIPE
jgi:hypothetical protein